VLGPLGRPLPLPDERNTISFPNFTALNKTIGQEIFDLFDNLQWMQPVKVREGGCVKPSIYSFRAACRVVLTHLSQMRG
jgi:hypothetical protein